MLVSDSAGWRRGSWRLVTRIAPGSLANKLNEWGLNKSNSGFTADPKILYLCAYSTFFLSTVSTR